MEYAEVISRWIHVGTAIVLVGGSVFMRFVLMPAASELPEDQHEALKKRVLGRWKRFVHTGSLSEGNSISSRGIQDINKTYTKVHQLFEAVHASLMV